MPSYALPLGLGILGLVIGPFVAAEQGWNFGQPGGIETLGRDLISGAALFAVGGIFVGLALNLAIRYFGIREGE